MRVRFLLIFLLTLSGCATSFFDRDQKNPIYHNGGNVVVTPILPRAESLIGMNTGSSVASPPQKQPPSSEELAIGGVLASGITLAMNKDYYRSSYLSGRCRCVARHEPGFEIPCGTVTVILEDTHGHEISRITSDDGDFVFPVEKDKQYQIYAYSAFYTGRYKETKPLRMGDSMVLNLHEKSAKAAE